MTTRANCYNTGIASEYLIMSHLFRLEIESYLSLGNEKSIDIRAFKNDGTPISIDVKSVRGYSSLVVNNIESKIDHFIVFVIYKNKFSDLTSLPDIFIVPSTNLPKITSQWKDQKRVMKSSLIEYQNKWNNLIS